MNSKITAHNKSKNQSDVEKTGDVNKPFLYQSHAQYQAILPEYMFDGMSDLDIASADLNKMVSARPGPVALIDCGAGPGRIWNSLNSNITQIIAVEPNRGMWNPNLPARASYVESDAFEYLRSFPANNRVITFLWSINYPLLKFFECYDGTLKRLVRHNPEKGDAECRQTVRDVLRRNSGSDFYIIIFDDSSEEQQFVTKIWENVAQFPFNDRAYTRDLLLEEMQGYATAHDADLIVKHYSGFADYGKSDMANQRLLNFHLRGHFNDDNKTLLAVSAFLSQYSNGDIIKVPAGMYVIKLLHGKGRCAH
jgi:hypothetical protein